MVFRALCVAGGCVLWSTLMVSTIGGRPPPMSDNRLGSYQTNSRVYGTPARVYLWDGMDHGVPH